ncbi:DUF4832 domain-containing protein [Paenibacillus zeisoli]|uniref:DUF4832 domain-containing protein n=1 Tax=Paenibacillus zeisoli TaxID=2496267 RepID=UPI001FEA6793|nr:DUF4832 domain-containing protein [Paenibacillus zeisoli]
MNKITYTSTVLGLSLLVGSLSTGPVVEAASNTPTLSVVSSATSKSSLSIGAKKTTQAKPAVKKSAPVVHTINALPAIKLSGNSSVRLSEVNLLAQDEGSIVTYTLSFNNGNSKSLDLTDYWTRVRSAGGSVYSAALKSTDAAKKSVAPGSTATLTYIVKVGRNVKISDLAFQIVKWDFSQPNYESSLGAFKIPASYLISTPAGQSKTFRINEAPVKMKVSQVTSYLSGDYNYVGVNVDLQNIGYKLFEDPKVKMVIKTAGGSSYPLTADSLGTDYRIQPQDTKKLNLMASIPKSIPLKNLELQIIQDDEATKLSLPLATLQLPAVKNQSITVKPYAEKVIVLPAGKIAASVKGAWVNQSYDDSDLAVQFAVRNVGTTTVTVPKYDFVLHTAGGNTIPFTVTGIDNMTLKPQEEKNIRMNITIPSNWVNNKLQLFVNIPQPTGDVPKDAAGQTPSSSKDPVFTYPVGVFALPEAKLLENTTGVEQFMQTNNGLVGLTLSNIQRLPWTDGDLVTAKVVIANRGNKTINLPDLAGQLTVDSAKLSADTKLVSTQSAGLLGIGMTTDLYIVGKVPSYLNFAQLQIALLEKSGDPASPTTSPWFQFTNFGVLPGLSTIKKDAAYQISTNGRKEEFKVLRTTVYPGSSSDIVYSEVEINNLEDHQIDLSQMVGFYKGSSGQSYRAKAIQIETPAGPKEKSIVAFWTKIPSKNSVSDMKLILGEGITDNKLTPVKGDPNGYINAAEMEVNFQPSVLKAGLKDIQLFPYTLNVNKLDVYLTASTTVNVDMNYTLSKNTSYNVGELGHKLVFELKDSTGRIFEKEVAPETDLKLSENGSFAYTVDDAIFDGMSYGAYSLSVYDVFQGQKVMLATQNAYYNTSRMYH